MRFKVCGDNWQVITVKPIDTILRRSDGTRSMAVTDGKTKTVYLANNIPADKLEKVLAHEICHVICFVNRIYLPIEEEERIAGFVSEYGREIRRIVDLLSAVLL